MSRITLFQNELRNAKGQIANLESLQEVQMEETSNEWKGYLALCIVASIVAFFMFCNPYAIRTKLDKMNG